MYKYTVIFKSSSFEYTSLNFYQKLSPAVLENKTWLQDDEGTFVNLDNVRELRIDEESDDEE